MRARRTVLALVGALVVGACASEADGDLAGPDAASTGGHVGEFGATPEYLHGVAAATDGQSYRIEAEMSMEMSVPDEEGFAFGGSVMSGEVDGERSSTVIDMRSMMEQMAPGDLLAHDLTMTIVTDGEAVYIQAPIFRAMADVARSGGASTDDLGPLAAIADLGEDEWGRVDISELSTAEVAQTIGAQGASPDVFLDLAAGGTDVRDLGTGDIRGVEARGLGAVATYEQLLEAQGLEADDLQAQVPVPGPDEGVSADEIDDVYAALLAMEVPLEVWVDADDNVLRASMSLDVGGMMDGLAEIAPEAGEVEMRVGMTMDMFDHGDETIDVQIPAESTDVTDELVDLSESGGVGGPGSVGPLPS